MYKKIKRAMDIIFSGILLILGAMKFRQKGIPFGFGGIAALGKGLLPSEYNVPFARSPKSKDNLRACRC